MAASLPVPPTTVQPAAATGHEEPAPVVHVESDGSTLAEYLGWSLTLEQQREIDLPRQLEIADCMSVAGHGFELESPDPTPLQQQRREDPGGFAAEYGYGFYATEVLRVESTIVEPTTTEARSPSWVDAYTKCSEAAVSPLEAILPPPEVFRRVAELYEESEQRPDLVAARSAWSVCMDERGFDVSSDADVRSLLVERVVGLPLLLPDEDAAENPYVISDADLARLISFEREVFQADMECRGHADLDAIERSVEDDILETVRGEFEFGGVKMPNS